MKRPGTVLLHLLIMLGYSVLFFILNATLGNDMVGFQWAVLLLHILVLIVWGAVNLVTNKPEPAGGQLLLASLVVALIGHGLCFMNGLMTFNVH